MTLTDAIELWITNGWHLDTNTRHVAILSYDDRGYWIRSFDRTRSREGRMSLSWDPDRNIVSPRLISKATTNLLAWQRYLSTKRKMKNLMEAEQR